MNKNKKNSDVNLSEEEIDEVLPEEETTEAPEDEAQSTIDELQAENQKLKEDYLRAFAEAENTKNVASKK